MDQFLVLVGRVVKPQGVGGEMKVYPLTDDVNRFTRLREVVLVQGDRRQTHRVVLARAEKNFAFLRLEGVDTRDAAERYRGFEVRVDRCDVPPLKDRWYYFELEGMRVYEGDALLGVLVRVLETGANDVYLVQGEFGEICVPALKSVVKNVDVAGKRMDVVLPEGLIESTKCEGK
ncbi:MAG: ribosome maturation factor RimM [Peptococcaceae bacterium]|nr:ribosome maturation factor RimM [Peptococcaceae bacterium]